mgnify:CR=1 FL=1
MDRAIAAIGQSFTSLLNVTGRENISNKDQNAYGTMVDSANQTEHTTYNSRGVINPNTAPENGRYEFDKSY